MDPYKVLGILPHSSELEVKNAFDKLVETYNLDDLQDDSIRSFYEEKLNEANDAYRIIVHNLACEEVRDLIDSDDFIAAETKLNMVSDVSSAEWNYLKGVLLLKKGWIDSGVNHIKKAVSLNPYSNEYTSALKTLNQRVSALKRNYNGALGSRNQDMNLCNNSNTQNKPGLC